jgi:hypothetical protein
MRSDSDHEDPQLSAGEVAFAIIILLGACFAVFFAWVTDAILSSGESGSHQTPLLIIQLVVAVAGLVPAGLFARSFFRHDSRAGLWLIIGILTYLAWGLLNDAAVHGHITVF